MFFIWKQIYWRAGSPDSVWTKLEEWLSSRSSSFSEWIKWMDSYGSWQ